MGQTVIGLDVGTWSVKAAVLDSGLRRFTLQEVREHRVARGPDGAVVSAEEHLAVAAALEGLRDRSVIATAVPGQRVMTRELTLPFTDPKKIRSVLGFELEGRLPVDLSDMVYDYAVLEAGEEGARLLCSAVERDWLRGFLDELAAANADPKVVGLDTMAYAQLAPHLPPSEAGGDLEPGEGEPVAFLDLGHTTTSVTIVRDGRVELVRTLARGGHEVTLALAEALDLDYLQAERVKHRGVRLDGRVPEGVGDAEHGPRVRVVSQALRPLVRDLRGTLHAYAQRGAGRVERAFVLGGTARMPGLVATLEGALGLTLQRAHLGAADWAQGVSGAHEPEALDLSQGKAVALALAFAREAGAGVLNFRQGEFAFESDFKAVRGRAWALGLMVAALLSVFLVKQYLHLGELEEQHKALVAALESFTADTLGKKSQNFSGTKAKLVKPPKAEGEEIFPQLTALHALDQITADQDAVNAMKPPKAAGDKPPGPRSPSPPTGDGDKDKAALDEEVDPALQGYKVEFEAVTIDLKGALIRGEVSGIEALEEFTGRLKKRSCFRAVETTDTHKSPNRERPDWLRFTVKVDIECKPPTSDKDKKGKKGKGATGGTTSKAKGGA